MRDSVECPHMCAGQKWADPLACVGGYLVTPPP
jgi:hypothetical protein